MKFFEKIVLQAGRYAWKIFGKKFNLFLETALNDLSDFSDLIFFQETLFLR